MPFWPNGPMYMSLPSSATDSNGEKNGQPTSRPIIHQDNDHLLRRARNRPVESTQISHSPTRLPFVTTRTPKSEPMAGRVKYIIADQLAVEAKQEDESEYEGGGGASYNGGEAEAAAAAAAGGGGGGVAETKGTS